MESEWRCRKCGTLLGTTSGQRVHVSHKGAQYIIGGEQYAVIAVCRACAVVNELENDRDPGPRVHSDSVVGRGPEQPERPTP